jgi:glycerol-3-phosphate dehydrogenase
MDYDLCVIGGGINGAGIARDAAGRGLNVLLVEAQDLASATSSASTKLVHGGLRYLEHYEFKLVKESLQERETLLKAAPHIIWPLKFVLPHNKHLRPYWMIKAGMFLYDRLYNPLGFRRKLQKSEALDFATDSLADPLKDKYVRGFSYSDCWVEDARLVALNAMDAKNLGATILTRTACTDLNVSQDKKSWNIHLQDLTTGDAFLVNAKMVVNAAGPWVRSLLDGSHLKPIKKKQKDFTPNVRLVKGSHIVVPKLYPGDHTYILQQEDGRIIFTIPYEYNYTLIGTTDKPFDGDASAVEIDQDEVDYLCNAVNQSFKKQITADDVKWTYSGVRSLVDDGKENASKVTRDYKLYMDERYGPPILSVFGGKITTYRALAEHAVDRLRTIFPDKKMKPWTANSYLPGGDITKGNFDAFIAKQTARYTFLNKKLLYRYARAYGTRMDVLMEGVNKVKDLGEDYGDRIYEAEIKYLIQNEFARDLDDVLWRRSKLGLHISNKTKTTLQEAFPKLLKKHKPEDE